MDKAPDADAVMEYLKKAQPAMGEIGFGGVMGYCSGMAFRKAGRAAAVVLGGGFVAAQVATSYGYLNVDWEKVKDDAIRPLDVVRILHYYLNCEILLFQLGFSLDMDWSQ